jgi:branched-chain amino acid transport system permease protein
VLIVTFIFVTTIVENPFYQDIIISTLFWATVATAWNLLGGFAGQTSLGHAAFFGIGAYTSTILYIKFGVSPWIGMLLGATISVLIAIIISYPTFRLTSHFFALATIAFNEVLQRVALFARGLTDGGVGLLIPFKPGIKHFMFDEREYIYT